MGVLILLKQVAVKTAPTVFHAKYESLVVSRALLDELIEVMNQEGKTSRLCLHPNIDDKVHQSIIVSSNKVENKIHYHPNKPETIYPLLGQASLDIYDSDKNKLDAIQIMPFSPLVISIPKSTLHNLNISTSVFVFLEISEGPFTKYSTVYV